MFLENSIALRYFLPKRKILVIHIISILSILSMSFSNAALLVSSSIYNGLEKQLLSSVKILTPDILVKNITGFLKKKDLQKLIASKDIQKAYAIWEEVAIVSSNDVDRVMIIKFIEPYTDFLKTNLHDSLIHTHSKKDNNGAAIGIAAALAFGNFENEKKLVLFTIKTEKDQSGLDSLFPLEQKSISVNHLFSIDNKIDQNYLFVPYNTFFAEKDTHLKNSHIHLYVNPTKDFCSITKQVKQILSEYNTEIKIFSEMDITPLKILKIEKIGVHVVFFLILLISCFTLLFLTRVISLLKSHDIYILQSYGFGSKNIKKIFLFVNGYISILSLVLGSFFFIIFLFLQNKFNLISLGAEIGNSDKLSIVLSLKNFLSINSISLAIMTLFSLLASTLVTPTIPK